MCSVFPACMNIDHWNISVLKVNYWSLPYITVTVKYVIELQLWTKLLFTFDFTLDTNSEWDSCACWSWRWSLTSTLMWTFTLHRLTSSFIAVIITGATRGRRLTGAFAVSALYMVVLLMRMGQFFQVWPAALWIPLWVSWLLAATVDVWHWRQVCEFFCA